MLPKTYFRPPRKGQLNWTGPIANGSKIDPLLSEHVRPRSDLGIETDPKSCPKSVSKVGECLCCGDLAAGRISAQLPVAVEQEGCADFLPHQML